MASSGQDRARHRAWLVCAAMVLAFAVGCSGDSEDDADGAPPSTTVEAAATTGSSTTAPTPEEAAKAAYLALVDAVNRLVRMGPDPDDSELPHLATDPVLSNIRDNLTTMAAEHHLVEPGPRTSHEVMSTVLSEPDVVILRDCSVGNDTTVDQDDGRVVDEGLTTRLLEARIVLTEGRWLVSSIGTVVRLDGEVPCPE